MFLIFFWWIHGMKQGSISPQVSEKTRSPSNNFWTCEVNCYFLKVDKSRKYGEYKKHWKYKFSNVLLTWYKFNLWKKFKSNTKLNFKYCISLSKYRLSEERSAIAHLSTHLKYILDTPLSSTLNISTYSALCSGSKKSLYNSYWPMIRRNNSFIPFRFFCKPFPNK